MSTEYYSNGKLLITGEYLVLDGALALAVPTQFGQSLTLEETNNNIIEWNALDQENQSWFQSILKYENNGLIFPQGSSPGEQDLRLKRILEEASKLNPDIIKINRGFKIVTKLDFPQNWGLGSSSTLINNIAQWFKIDPYQLLEKTFGGSGYDIAAAQTENPITYQLHPNSRSVLNANFQPSFKNELFFVYLNHKQNSRSSIAQYRQQPTALIQNTIRKISDLTSSFISCETLEEFNLLIEIHETIISKCINTPRIKSQLFPDFNGAIKSLGGWGGDFILATGGESEKTYFQKKGYTTILDYSEMIK